MTDQFFGFKTEQEFREWLSDESLFTHLKSIASVKFVNVCSDKPCLGWGGEYKYSYTDGSKDNGIEIPNYTAKFNGITYNWCDDPRTPRTIEEYYIEISTHFKNKVNR